MAPEAVELRRLRREKRLSVARLSEMASVARDTVRRIEVGARVRNSERHRLIETLRQYVPAHDYRREMREWRLAHGLTVVRAAAMLGVRESVWRTAELRGYKYGPRGGLREKIDALLASDPAPAV